jgi:putative SOS response-associated peptidase YedK
MERKQANAGFGQIPLLLHPGSGGSTAMCGRFEQSETPRYYADALSTHISGQLKTLNGDSPSYNVAPGQRPWMIMLHNGELLFIGMTWGYRTPKESREKKKPWI